MDNGTALGRVGLRCLRAPVDALLDPGESGATLANLTAILPGRGRGFRKRLFKRRADVSAHTTLSAETTEELDAALHPDRLAWTLLVSRP
ncbi:hypothetical protein AB0G51_20460 [Streptomyces asoensis]|uniref:hypothetical protein n=1 Tax=Streptomyces asoensis TaxID=249586 RepID=UPI00340F8D74